MRPTLIPMTMLAFLTPVVLSAQSYAIHLSTPLHAGQSFTFTSSGSKTAKMTSGIHLVSEENYQVSVEGRADVIEVDRAGMPFKLAFTVAKLTKTAGGATTTLLKPGSVILADGSQDQPFSLQDGTLDAPTREAFGIVYSAHKPDDVSDDDIFGTRELKRLGDSWPIDSARAAESLKSTGIAIPAGHLSGTMTLVAKDRLASADCLSLRGEFQADAFMVGNLPPGLLPDQAFLKATIQGCFPLDGAGASRREGAEITMKLRLATKDGTTFDATYSQTYEALWAAIAN